ncbi:CoA transferase [Conexibacter arvalis]|uniref:Crotonobetainyl-CoA:carnitine CoA-transferase CaiB-like acyl-CoA transferase n=1 Tax=Conexibacter arvalis TaxID=912552 RepID=A0A840IBE8_9ACTN|nr:crotonobetainyl-CoA:carnitine CoA-transferase CaiB-like acyl-CoA transferase [Conexibacter arvalis]
MSTRTDWQAALDAVAGAPRRQGPLRGVTVLDVTRVVAGPYCAMLLGDLGATVIKVENPAEPDYARDFPPFVGDGGDRFSGFFAQYNRNKLGITLDLKSPDGQALLRELVRRSDVLVENFRAGTMERLGLGYASLREENPALVYTAISGFGQYGPSSRKPAYDNSGQATGGLWSMNGYADREPVRVGTIIGDLSASLYAAFGTVAALREAERTGVGQLVDVSQQDAVLSLTETAVVDYTVAGRVAGPLGNDHPFVRPYGLFPCKDGHVFFGGYTQKLWRESCELFGAPELVDDPEIATMEQRFDEEVYQRRVKPIVEGWFASRTKAELEAIAGDRIPLSAVKDIGEVVADPQVAAREMVVDVDYPGGAVGMFGLPVKLSETPGDPRAQAPTPGQHNDDVLGGALGLSAERLAELRARGTI